MRKVIEKQLKIGQVDIGSIELDLQSRDEIPQLLLGLQAIYTDKPVRDEVFAALESMIPDNVDKRNGRPGMELWKILVLGTLRLNCNWDYDKLHDISNNHEKVREFLGHSKYDFDEINEKKKNKYKLQTLKDNVSLFTPEVLDRISQIVVKAGHRRFGDDEELKGRCDSSVVKTDVHHPTDINLLWDAIRKIIQLIAKDCDGIGITEWRQYRHILRKIKKLFNKAQRLKPSKSKDERKKEERDRKIVEAYQAYVDLAEHYVERAKRCTVDLTNLGFDGFARAMLIEKFIVDAGRQIDQIRRRVVSGEKIPHGEKVFSIFERHTEWIVKGKAGVSQELGLNVCILEDQHGFILHHHVMEKQVDEQVAVSMVAEAKEKFPTLNSCSFDKGFHSQPNQKKLPKYLDNIILPRKGRLSEEAKRIEWSAPFVAARKQHAAVESAISALKNHALDRCPDHGIDGFKRYVALSILARNLQVLGAKIRKKALKRLKREERRAA
ncbi:MAG: ISNCY family transposase [Deltaproteobacteria bacterium]|nr:ISNCY family transposase [Deltaproteobacteria bacterium]